MRSVPFDLERVRQETPGCERVLHFNNAGAALMPQPVIDSVIGHVKLESEIGGYEAAEQAEQAVDRVYGAAAGLIGCHPDEIAFLESATRAWDMAFYSLDLNRGDRILTCMAEYGSNFIAYLQVARKRGVSVEVIPNDESGQLSIESLRDTLDERVKLISITHVPTNGGLVNPAEEVGRIAREHEILFLLDACQSVGQMPLDVNRIGCHMMAATGRKFLRGPRGTGFLYVSRDLIERVEPLFLDIHSAHWVSPDRFRIRSDARRFETWEANCAAKIGLGVAIEYAMRIGLDAISQRVSALARQLRQRLHTIAGLNVRDLGKVKCGIVTFTVKGVEPEFIKARLADERINVSVSPLDYTRLDMESRALDSVVRASVHYYNTEDEIEQFCDALAVLIH